MAEQALDFIREAEKKASELQENALAQAQRLISDAENSAAEAERSMAERQRLALESAEREARQQAERQRVSFAAETKCTAEEHIQKLKGLQERAVQAVTDIITGA